MFLLLCVLRRNYLIQNVFDYLALQSIYYLVLNHNQHLSGTLDPTNLLNRIHNILQEYQRRYLVCNLMQNLDHSLFELNPCQSSEIHEIFLSKLLNLPLNEGKI